MSDWYGGRRYPMGLEFEKVEVGRKIMIYLVQLGLWWEIEKSRTILYGSFYAAERLFSR